MIWTVDRWLPHTLRDESAETRRRARLVVYAVGIAASVDVVTSLAMPVVDWQAPRAAFAAVHLAMHLPTLLLLRLTRSVAVASHYFIAVVALQSLAQIGPSHGFSGFGLIALPVAAAHLVGLRALGGWTAAAVAAALIGPLALGDGARGLDLGVAIATITAAIGGASAIVESSRARAASEALAAEASTRLHRERLRAFVEQTFPILAEVHENRLLFLSENVASLVGVTPGDAYGAVRRFLHPADLEAIRAHVGSSPHSRRRFELRVRQRDGRWIWCEVFAIPFGASAQDSRWLFAARSIDDEVTQRERLERAQRLEGIGTLAAGLAHDFNNLLMVISGFGARLPESDARDQVLSAAASAGELTSQLLAFGRSGPSVDELIDPEREVGSLAPLARSVLGEEIAFSVRGGADGATVRIAPGRLKQVLLNLVANAREATPRGGRVEIAVRRAALSAEQANALELTPGDYVEIVVSDDGHGMTEEVRRRAFDPFFSTKSPERGSGLGLASAYGVARHAGGTIALESEPGRGTRARVLLPNARAALPAPPRAALDQPRESGPASVWLVEDDERIRKLLESALVAAGHRVHAFPSGDAALAAPLAPPDLLVTDVVMPGVRGTELAARMRAASPETRVLYLSGYSVVEIGDWRSGERGVRFLAKPARPSDVVAAAAELLAP